MEIGSFSAFPVPTIERPTRRVSYAFTYRRKVAELRHNLQTLAGAKDYLQNFVDDARRRGEEIEEKVQKWLADAEEAIRQAEILIQGVEEAKKRIFAGLFPNFKVRCQIGQKAAKESLAIVSLESKGRFDRGQISHRAPLQQIVTTTVNCFEGLPSRKSILKQVMDALTDPEVNMIGLYGMSGIGKTTLASEVQRRAIETNKFDFIVMATISAKPRLKEIQTTIADVMGIRLEEKSAVGRASRLYQTLKEKQKILVILDDVWEAFELKTLGIPFGEEHKGCKVLLTSGNLHILTNKMGTQKFFKLELLSEDEAWELFQITVGNSKTQTRPIFAEEVVSNCGGNPLAIVSVAKALRNKQPHTWKNVLRQLSNTPRFDNREKGMPPELYAALELSFNHLVDLVGEEVKSLFLLFPLLVDSSISIRHLLEHVVGLGLFQGTDSIEDARNRLLELIGDLKASCFLQDGDEDGFLKMHDFVRAFARSIASRDQNAAVVKTDNVLKAFAERRIPNSCTRLSLVCSDIYELPEDLECPELEYLLVAGNRSLKIPDSFFERTGILRVLDCSQVAFSHLPHSLGRLKRLQTLCLHQCVLPNIAMVINLRNLEILSLLGSDITELPEEIGELTQLKSLDLTDCTKLQVIRENVLCRLYRLEELYMSNSFKHWEFKGLNNQCNASLSELENLCHLTNLEIEVPDAEKLSKALFSKKLERFKIYIGDVWNWDGKYPTSRTLKVKLHTNVNSWDLGVKILFKKAEDLSLNDVKGVMNVLYDLHKEGFSQLKHLLVQNSSDIRYIIDSEWRLPFTAFPILESLILHNLLNLEKICSGQLMTGDFCQLRILRVKSCNRLKNLFPFSTVRNLKQLYEMEVMDCSNIEEIFAGETKEEEENDKNEVFEFTQLCSLELQLPLLRRFCSKVKLSPASTSLTHLSQNQSTIDPRRPLFNEMIVFPKLKKLKLSSITVPNIWWNQFGDYSSFSNLTSLTVETCSEIEYLFTSAMVINLGQLQALEICECKLMEGVIAVEGEMISQILFPKLEFLKLKSLWKLVRFCNGDFVELPSLKKLWIENCPALKSFISNPVAPTSAANLVLFDEKVGLPNLEEFHVEDMNGLKIIWHNELHGGSFCQLKTMIVRRAEELVNVFPSHMLMSRFQNLEHLHLTDCELLEEVFDLPPHKEPMIDFTATPGVPVLKTLRIENLPNLKNIWKKDAQEREMIFFHKLHEVHVSRCPNLKSIFPVSIAMFLLELEKLIVEFCGIEVIIDGGTEVIPIRIFEFPQLTTLQLYYLENLKTLYPRTYTFNWPMLHDLRIDACPEMEIFSLKGRSIREKSWRSQSEIVFSKLKKLKLSSIAAPNIWWNQFGDYSSFSNLTSLTVETCSEIEYLFTSAMVRNLGQLQTLEICECKLMEGVIAVEGETISWMSFPKLEFLKLKCLWKLVRFCNGDFVELPSLKKLWIENCPALKSFISNPIAPTSAANLVLFDEKVGIPNLEEFHVEDMNGLKIIWHNELHGGSFCQLKTMIVRQAEELVNVFPSHMLMSRFQNLEHLHLTDCELLEEVFDLQPHKERMIDFSTMPRVPVLKTLRIENLPNLKNIWKKDAGEREKIFFHKLHEVHVSGCPNLKSFCPFSIAAPNKWWNQFGDYSSFSNLTSLTVETCSEIEYLFTSAMVRNLGQLQTLEICECKLMEGVIAVEGETISWMSFPKLEFLKLKCLWKLVRFCNGDFVELPSLKKLWIENCPALKSFISNPIAPTSAANLVLFDEKVGLPNLEEFHVEDMNGLKIIWHNELHKGSFCQLKTMSVQRAEELVNVFPSHMLMSWFQNLEHLHLTDCELLEEVFDLPPLKEPMIDFTATPGVPVLKTLRIENLPNLKNIWKKDAREREMIFFHKLHEVHVSRCPNLKSIFPVSIAMFLLELEKLVVEFCGIEVIIDGGTEVIPICSFEFPQLTTLQLYYLENLKTLYPGTFTVNWPVLYDLRIDACPRMEIFSLEGRSIREKSWRSQSEAVGTSQAISAEESNITAVATETVKVSADLPFTPEKKSFQDPSLVPVPVSIPTITEITEESDDVNTGSSAGSSVQGPDINSGLNKDPMAIPHTVPSSKETISAGETEAAVGTSQAISAEESNITAVAAETVKVSADLPFTPEKKSFQDPSLVPVPVSIPTITEITEESDDVNTGSSAGSSVQGPDINSGLNKDPMAIPHTVPSSKETISAGETEAVMCATDGYSFEKAWDLFAEQVGQVVDLPDIKCYARGIVEQCRGLPLLIILTGRALADENDVGVWDSAFKDFLLPVNVRQSDPEFFTRKFQFVYNRLKARGTKNRVMRTCDLQGCFLYCALFPQDHVINVSKVFECWMQEGLIAKSIADTCDNGHKIVEALVDAALLERVEDGHSVKMHKLIRDFALGQVFLEVEARQFLKSADLEFTQLTTFRSRSISGALDQYLIKVGEGMAKAPLEEEWEQAKMIFLMDNELDTLPEKPKCHNLSGLFLQGNHCLRSIPPSFFNYMPSLQVLNLSNTAITCLPKSISKLKSLKELIMRDCEDVVKLPSQLGVLQNLEVLDLCGTEIDQLPRTIEKLVSLKCMKVHFYGSIDQMEYASLPLELFGQRTISRLLSLSILGIVAVPGDPRWNKVAEAVTRDIGKLTNLIDLSFYFPRVELLRLFIKSSMSWSRNHLKKFNFVAGHDVIRMISCVPDKVDFEFNQRGQCLRFVNGETLPDAVCEVLSRTTAFYLDHHLQVSNLSQFGACNMTLLEVCVVRECPKMEKIIDSDEMTFPLLELLSIHYLENLQCILHGSLPAGSFACLKYLYVHTCHQLDFVVISSTSLYISNLEELVVEDCWAMTEIIREDNGKIVESNDILLPRLKSLKLHHLPELVRIWKGSWPSLERISIYDCPKLRNLNMDFDTALRSSIKEIKAERDWWSELEWKDTSLSQELQKYLVPLE